jgi:thiamine-monophosphate kinase
LALHGGEDYELLFTARPGKRVPPQIAGVALTRIGVVTRTPLVLLRNLKGIAYELEPRGWEHFRR